LIYVGRDLKSIRKMCDEIEIIITHLNNLLAESRDIFNNLFAVIMNSACYDTATRAVMRLSVKWL